MTKEYTIKVRITDDGPARDSQTLGTVGSSNFRVDMYPAPDGAPMVDVLAHELGHVLANIMDTPANAKDPRVVAAKNHIGETWHTMARLFGVSNSEAQRMVDAETEAWEIGKKIHPGTRKESVEFALGTYRKHLG